MISVLLDACTRDNWGSEPLLFWVCILIAVMYYHGMKYSDIFEGQGWVLAAFSCFLFWGNPKGWAAFEKVSIDMAGNWAKEEVVPSLSVSANGRYVVFNSTAGNLDPSDSNGVMDVFLHDRVLGTVTRISLANNGGQGNGNSQIETHRSISGDGRYIVFASEADNFLGPSMDKNNAKDIFLHDTQRGTTTLVSQSLAGRSGDLESRSPSISTDGKFVVFESDAHNLVSGDSNNASDIFLFEIATGLMTRVNVSSTGLETGRGKASFFGTINADGSVVAFLSEDENLVSGDTNQLLDVFIRDRKNQRTIRVSVSNHGNQLNGYSAGQPSISGDGCRVVFGSLATNVVDGEIKKASDIYVRDWCQQATILVNQNTQSQEATGGLLTDWVFAISEDGNRVAFASDAPNLSSWGKPSAGLDQIFLRDLKAGTTQLVSVAPDGTVGHGYSTSPALNQDGSILVFLSSPTTLIPGASVQTLQAISYVNAPPVASFVGQPSSISQTLSLSGNASYDPDGVILAYHWDFGDGQTSNDQNPTHRYPEQGTYLVTLTVTDNAYAQSSVSSQETVVTIFDLSGGGFSCMLMGSNIGLGRAWFSLMILGGLILIGIRFRFR